MKAVNAINITKTLKYNVRKASKINWKTGTLFSIKLCLKN